MKGYIFIPILVGAFLIAMAIYTYMLPDFIKLGGYLVPFLITLSILLFTFIAERLFTIRRAQGRGDVGRFTRNLRKAVDAGEIDGAIDVCRKQGGSIANVVGATADTFFAQPAAPLTSPQALLGALCYTLQIYFDFSGYSDMAIGLGRMFGFHFRENFDLPYWSVSLTDFWKRWHISLTSWFRDYLYVPLTGNQFWVPPWRAYTAMFTVFLLCGFWHGASWTFVVWGLFHGLFLVIERLGLGRLLASRRSVVQHVYTLLTVLTGWVIFRSESLSQAVDMLAAMAGFAHGNHIECHLGLYMDAELAIVLAVGLVASTRILPYMARALRGMRATLELAHRQHFDTVVTVGVITSLVTVFLTALSYMAAGTYSPFLYFRF